MLVGPSSFDFGVWAPDYKERERTIQIQNSGTEMTGTLHAEWPEEEGDFHILDGTGGDLGGIGAGEKRGIMLIYTGKIEGTFEKRLILSANPGGSIEILLKVKIARPAQLTGPALCDFGRHKPNDVEREHSFVIRNNGGQTSGTLRASWQGSKSVFRVVDGVGSDLGGLEAGRTRGIMLTYVKSPAGTYQARLVISAAPGGSITVLLKLVISGLVLPISSKGTGAKSKAEPKAASAKRKASSKPQPKAKRSTGAKKPQTRRSPSSNKKGKARPAKKAKSSKKKG